jgi:large subunit ribosomal protein L19
MRFAMSDTIIREIEQSQINTDLPKLSIGDTVDVHLRIIEGAKERIQVFNGVIIAMSGAGVNRTITVRRIVANEGVERVVPMHSPRVAKIEVKRHGHVRRSKLYYLRERVGKKRRLRDRRRGLESLLKKEVKPEVDEQAEVQAELDEPEAGTAEATEEKQEA